MEVMVTSSQILITLKYNILFASQLEDKIRTWYYRACGWHWKPKRALVSSRLALWLIQSPWNVATTCFRLCSGSTFNLWAPMIQHICILAFWLRLPKCIYRFGQPRIAMSDSIPRRHILTYEHFLALIWSEQSSVWWTRIKNWLTSKSNGFVPRRHVLHISSKKAEINLNVSFSFISKLSWPQAFDLKYTTRNALGYNYYSTIMYDIQLSVYHKF